MNNPTPCPNLELCPIFAYFKQYAKIVYQQMYCMSDYETCERYKLKETGQTVPDNLLPYGGRLWDEP